MRKVGLLIAAIHLLPQQKGFNPYEHRSSCRLVPFPRHLDVAALK